MQRLISAFLISLLLGGVAYAADSKVSALAAPAGGVATADKLYVVDVTGPTPTAETIANVLALAPGASGGTDVAVADGGTGASTLADGGLMVGNGTGAVEVVAPGATTQILVGGGAATAPTWGTDIPTAVTIGSAYIHRVGGTDVAVADGGTGGSDAATARTNLGLVIGTNVLAPNGSGSSLDLSTPPAIGGTTPAAGTFSTLSAGATGFSVDADGDTTAKSLTVTPTATPALALYDSDGAGADDYAASFEANFTTVTDGSEDADAILYTQVGGTKTAVLTFDADAANASFGTFGVQALTPVTGDCDDFAATFTGKNLYGGTFVANGTGTCVLPAVGVGQHFTIITLGAIAIVIDPNASDSMLSDGVQQADGANLTNLSTAGDMAVVQYYSSAGWLVQTNGWTQE